MKNLKKSIPKYFFLLLVILVTIGFFGLISDFALAVFWAATLAILFHKVFEKTKPRMRNSPNLAAGATVGLILLIAIIPIAIVGVVGVDKAITLTEKTEVKKEKKTKSEESIKEQIGEKMDDFQDQINKVDKETLNKMGISKKKVREKIEVLFSNIAESIGALIIEHSKNIPGFLISFFVMIYTLFFFIRDGKAIRKELMRVIPMKNKLEVELFNRFESVARATIKGSLVVAFVQGVLAGLLFWALGIDGAFFWGVIMILASLLPIGSALVWGPYAIILLMSGDYTKAIIMIAVGVGFIGLIDNFLRPSLVGKDTKMPDYLILLSTLGGIAWFGISGFVLGPILAALFVTFWQIMGKEYGESQNVN